MVCTVTDQFIVDELCAATTTVCSTMLALEAKPDTPFIQRALNAAQDGLEGLVSFTGPCVGTGVIWCDFEMACYLSSCFLAMPITTVDEMVLDAMGELTNMIIGNFKNALEERVGPLAMGIPTVVCGKQVLTRAMKEDQWLVVPFSINGQRLSVRICFASQSGNA